MRQNKFITIYTTSTAGNLLVKKLILSIVLCCLIICVALQGCTPVDIKGGAVTENPQDGNLVNEVNLSSGIEFPWNYGWTLAISVVPGLPIHFSCENQECSITVSADNAELLGGIVDGNYPVMQQPVHINSGDTVYWCDLPEKEQDIYYVDALFYEQGNIVGYGIVKIESKVTTVGGKAYFASILKNIQYPKTADNQYQSISESYVKEKIQEIKSK